MRAQFPQSSLADLYDPLTMPPALVKAHPALDVAVDAAYSKRGWRNNAERVAILFERYQAITSLLPAPAPARKRRAAGDGLSRTQRISMTASPRSSAATTPGQTAARCASSGAVRVFPSRIQTIGGPCRETLR
jgi:hypothetical protein